MESIIKPDEVERIIEENKKLKNICDTVCKVTQLYKNDIEKINDNL